MNKNTKQRLARYRAEKKAQGTFPASIYKRKAKQFPRPNPDVDMSLKAQSKMFYGEFGVK